MKWFVDSNIATAAIREKKLIEEEDVECRPEMIPSSVLNENVDVCLVRHYFSADAWMVVQDVIGRKAKMDLWECSVCQHDLHDGRKSRIMPQVVPLFLCWPNEGPQKKELVLSTLLFITLAIQYCFSTHFCDFIVVLQRNLNRCWLFHTDLNLSWRSFLVVLQ